jgi:hypothetical protein
MSDDTSKEPNDEFRDMLRSFLEGNSDMDPAKLASAAGLPSDPAAVQQLMQQLQNAMSTSGDGIDWSSPVRVRRASPTLNEPSSTAPSASLRCGSTRSPASLSSRCPLSI